MRYFIGNQTAHFIAKVDRMKFPSGVGPTLRIRVIGAGVVYLSQNRNWLDDVDGSGVPRQGEPLSNTDPVRVDPNFSGELWGRSTSAPSLEVEVSII